MPAFKQLEKPHARVHEGGFAAMKALQEDNWGLMFECLQDMEDASTEVMSVLSVLETEAQADRRARSTLPAAMGDSVEMFG